MGMRFSSTQLLLIAQKWLWGVLYCQLQSLLYYRLATQNTQTAYPQPAVWLDSAGPRTQLSVVLKTTHNAQPALQVQAEEYGLALQTNTKETEVETARLLHKMSIST